MSNKAIETYFANRIANHFLDQPESMTMTLNQFVNPLARQSSGAGWRQQLDGVFKAAEEIVNRRVNADRRL